MMRVLFIGNSHLAALRTAWAAAAPPGIEAEFFAAPHRAFLRMTLQKGNHFGLAPDSEFLRQSKITQEANGKIAVSLAERDIVVLVGAFSAAEKPAGILAGCDVAGMRHSGAATLLSQPLFDSICKDFAVAALPEAGWRDCGAKMILLPRPATCATCLASTNPAFAPWHDLARSPLGVATAFDRNDANMAEVFADHGLNYLPQPTGTRTDFGATATQFLAEGGGVVTGQEHKRGDHAHMNPAYGAICAQKLLAALQSPAQLI